MQMAKIKKLKEQTMNVYKINILETKNGTLWSEPRVTAKDFEAACQKAKVLVAQLKSEYKAAFKIRDIEYILTIEA
jgi:hypothetical protein